jgi:hypothetical protein
MAEIKLNVVDPDPTEPLGSGRKKLRKLEEELSIMKFQLADEGEPDWLKWSVERRMPDLRKKLRAQYIARDEQEAKRGEFIEKQNQRQVGERVVGLAFNACNMLVQQIEDVSALNNPELFSHALKMGLENAPWKSELAISPELFPLFDKLRALAKAPTF